MHYVRLVKMLKMHSLLNKIKNRLCISANYKNKTFIECRELIRHQGDDVYFFNSNGVIVVTL